MHRALVPSLALAVLSAAACDINLSDPSDGGGTGGDAPTSGTGDQGDSAAADDETSGGADSGQTPADDTAGSSADDTAGDTEDAYGCIAYCQVVETCEARSESDPECVSLCESDFARLEPLCSDAYAAFNQCLGALTCDEWNAWAQADRGYPCEAAEIAFADSCDTQGGSEIDVACSDRCAVLAQCDLEADENLCYDTCVGMAAEIQEPACLQSTVDLAWCIGGLFEDCAAAAAAYANEDGNVCQDAHTAIEADCPAP